MDGYELSLSGNGSVFVRFNQASSANAYKLFALTPYPSDGSTWMHVAATFDGSESYVFDPDTGTLLSIELPLNGSGRAAR